MAAAVLPEKKVSLWAARSRQRCVGVLETENEDDHQQQHQLGPAVPVNTVVPERAQAEALTADRLEKFIETNSRYSCVSRLIVRSGACTAVLEC